MVTIFQFFVFVQPNSWFCWLPTTCFSKNPPRFQTKNLLAACQASRPWCQCPPEVPAANRTPSLPRRPRPVASPSCRRRWHTSRWPFPRCRRNNRPKTAERSCRAEGGDVKQKDAKRWKARLKKNKTWMSTRPEANLKQKMQRKLLFKLVKNGGKTKNEGTQLA